MRATRVSPLLLAIACGEESPPDFITSERCWEVPEEFPDDTVVVRSAADLEAIRDRTELSALVACEMNDVEAIELPNLVKVEFGIFLSFCPELREISMPSLRSAGTMSLGHMAVIERIDFGSLEEAESIALDRLLRLSSVRFPSLVRLASSFSVTTMPANSLDLPMLTEASLVSVLNTGLGALRLPVLSGRPTLVATGNSVLEEVSALNLQALSRLEVTMNPRMMRVDLPQVERILGSGLMLVPSEAPEIDLTGLRQIGGALRMVLGGGDLSGLPSLESVGWELFLVGEGSTDFVGMDALASVGGFVHLGGGSIEVVRFPSLSRIDGDLTLGIESVSEVSMPSLESVAAIHLNDDTIGAPSRFGSLRELLGDLQLYDVVEVDLATLFPSLERIHGSIVMERNEMETIRLPALSIVDGDLTLRANSSTIASFPALRGVGANLSISRHPGLLALELPSITSVGVDLTIAGNPSLPTCEAGAIVSRLGGAIGGAIDISGNSEGAECAER